MDLKHIVTNKKFKNILITICEILVVAGIIFGVLMFIQSKVNKEADQLSGVDRTVSNDADTEEEDAGSDKYYIEVNIKKSAVIIYQYSSDKKTKNPYKIFKCSIGEELQKGKYKISGNYSWININGSWHRYNSQFGTKAWIQSAGYSDKYANTLKKSSYKAIGNETTSGSCILLYAKDAEWIYTNCKTNTVVNVVKGKKSDTLPLDFEQTVQPYKYCGWDPTDPDSDNPYKKMENGKIVNGSSIVYVEKSEEAEYLSNLLAKDENGKNITGSLKYKEFSTDEMGTYKVKYSYKMASGEKIIATQKFVVVDTTCPVVTCSKKQFTYEVKSMDDEDLHNESNITDIEKLIRSSVSCNESGVTITVTTVSAEELDIGNIPVIIKAQDEAGNVGSCQVMCEITVEKPKTIKKFELTDEQKEKIEKQRSTEEETTTAKKKKSKKETATEKETTKKSSDNKDEDTTTVNE